MAAPGSSDFLGRGWAFPVKARGGRVLLASDAADIRQAIEIILRTHPGERVMLPDFGCRINELVFGAGNAATCSLAELHARQALDRREPRIQTTSVSAVMDPVIPACLRLTVGFTVLARNQPDNVVYPFYLT
ncbi:baseplate assembly protein [Sphingomonas sp. Leaf33]|nr:baseplate assembly protein [Sphingomonas sp. Leaf33]